MGNFLSTVLDKCNILYGDHLISKETILRSYWQFLSEVASKNERISFAFHTGSVCFEAVAILSTVLSCLKFNTISNDDILASLELNEIVLYKGQRYRWKGITVNDDGIETMVLEQDGTGKNGATTTRTPYQRNKQYVTPYNGTSTVTDGRGIRKRVTNREEVLAALLEIPPSEVPSVIEASTVIVAKKQKLLDIAKSLKVQYHNKEILLFDLLPAAYYTGNGTKMAVGHNPSKAEPVIRITEQMSVARDMITDKNMSVVGMLVLDPVPFVVNSGELDDLMGRNNPKFIHVSLGLRSDAEERSLDLYPDTPIFACTKGYLEQLECNQTVKNTLTLELSQQLYNIKNPNLVVKRFDSVWNDEIYRKLQENLYLIRNSMLSDDIKENFVISAHALMRLFSTAIFPVSSMEKAVADGKINSTVIPPNARIAQLWEYAEQAGHLQELFLDVIASLEKQYQFCLNETPKSEWLRNYINEHPFKRIAIIVPKAYYIDIIANEYQLDPDRVTCTTNHRFQGNENYDVIITLCWIPNRYFDPLQCYSAKQIQILLYSYENKMFACRQRKIEKLEARLNGETENTDAAPNLNRTDSYVPDDETANQMLRSYFDLEHFIEKMNTKHLQHIISNTFPSGNSTTTEIICAGRFVNGDHIFFSKQYSAVVFDPEKKSIKEKAAKSLVSGDILVFTYRDDYTRNIVDIIFEKLLETEKLSPEIAEAKRKASYWKEALRSYKKKNTLMHREVAQRLRKSGAFVEAATIREWLSLESHTVGPQKEKTMEAIARLTQDTFLLSNPHEYFQACRTVRHTRREILNMISSAIIDQLSGNAPETGSNLEVVYQNVDNLAVTMELEDVKELEETLLLQIGLVNRPISDEEVS